MTGPRYTRLVQSLPATVPFVGPETQERARGAGFEARLGANENGFGPSPRAIAAMAEAIMMVTNFAAQFMITPSPVPQPDHGRKRLSSGAPVFRQAPLNTRIRAKPWPE